MCDLPLGELDQLQSCSPKQLHLHALVCTSLLRLVIIIVSKSGFFHAGMVKSRLYSPLRDKYGSSKVPPPDLGTQIRTSLRYLSLKQSCVSVDKTLGLRPRVLSTETQLCFAERYLPDSGARTPSA